MSDKIIAEFLKENPNCNPNNPDGFIQAPPTDCSDAHAQGGGCALAHTAAVGEIIPECNDKSKPALAMKSAGNIAECLSSLTFAFNYGAISLLANSNQQLFSSLSMQAVVFDQRLELFEEELTGRINVSSIVSSTNLILLLIIITYLLFSKIFT